MGHPGGDRQVALKNPDFVQAQPIGRAAEIAAKRRDCMDVGSSCRRRQIVVRRALDPAAARRVRLRRRAFSCPEDWASTLTNFLNRRPFPYPYTPFPRRRVCSIVQGGIRFFVGWYWTVLNYVPQVARSFLLPAARPSRGGNPSSVPPKPSASPSRPTVPAARSPPRLLPSAS